MPGITRHLYNNALVNVLSIKVSSTVLFIKVNSSVLYNRVGSIECSLTDTLKISC